MKKQTALKTVLIISIIGTLFSGFMSYSEIFRNVCYLGGCTTIKGIPSCAYGLVLYLISLIISLFGLLSKK